MKAYRVPAVNYTVYPGTCVQELEVQELGVTSVFFDQDHSLANELRVTQSALWFPTFADAYEWVRTQIESNARQLDLKRRELATLYEYIRSLKCQHVADQEAHAMPAD